MPLSFHIDPAPDIVARVLARAIRDTEGRVREAREEEDEALNRAASAHATVSCGEAQIVVLRDELGRITGDRMWAPPDPFATCASVQADS